MHIITTYFAVRRLAGSIMLGGNDVSARELEYRECIANNAASSAVSRVHLLVQDVPSYQRLATEVLPKMPPADRAKVQPVLYHNAPHQPLYSCLFGHARHMLQHAGSVMICYADIYVGDDFPTRVVEDKLAAAGACGGRPLAMALTRYESEASLNAPLIDDYQGSHDAFIVRPRDLTPAFINGVRHRQNCYKAENIVIHELTANNFRVVNPCYDARIFHKHEADFRQWMPPADEERYGRAYPCQLRDV